MYCVSFGLTTYAVLLGSYVLTCLPFEIMHKFHLCRDKLIQPKYKSPENIRSKAFTMVAFNFTWLLALLLVASPVLEWAFPEDASFPTLPNAGLQILLSFIVDDLSFYTYHRYLHTNKSLYALYHKPHHIFKAPFAWTVSSSAPSALN